MKRKLCKLLTGILLSCTLAGSAVVVQAEENQGAVVTSYLTGENVSEAIGRRRPVAVMLGNDSVGAPQSGTENAGVIYEAPVEGSITRLMAIIEDYDNIPRIGSVRSCRDYFLFYANEYDAIYSHYGQAVYALQYLDQHLIDNLNGLTLGNAYYRTTDRVAPHNAYTDFSHLQAGIQSQGYSQDYKEDYNGHFQFAPEGTETTLDDGVSANVVKLDNYAHNHPWFEYNAETKEYSRFQFNAPHIDQNTGNQLTCENIILQYSDYVPYDPNGYLNIDTQSGGKGKYITRGKAIDIQWTKDSQWGITHYYNSASGEEIQLNPGKTWVEIVLNDTVDSVSIQ
nr:DUF3048 domain-containing protein [uncultured Blautia sp.]